MSPPPPENFPGRVRAKPAIDGRCTALPVRDPACRAGESYGVGVVHPPAGVGHAEGFEDPLGAEVGEALAGDDLHSRPSTSVATE